MDITRKTIQLCHIEVEDEQHFILACSELESSRQSFYDKINDICPAFSSMNNSDKFNLYHD